ncbi:amino acid adenylation domain-containing protein [Streptomyces fuscichromogenes]|uniref:amino acid adenylation domain-containing protein n=1 Tax=Streptomyces fuscichromogenes TaxID=1324013 RepID=UPI0037F14004
MSGVGHSVRTLVGRVAELRSPTNTAARAFWCDDVPGASDSPVARRRLHTELHRALDPHAPECPPVRVVLLRYDDQVSDLVLVSHRAVLDAPSLRTAAEALALGDEISGIATAHPSWPPAAGNEGDGDGPQSAELGTMPAWGAPDPHGTVPTDSVGAAPGVRLDHTVEDLQAGLMVAAAIVLGRYEDQDRLTVAALAADPDRPEGVLGTFEFGALFLADLTGEQRIGELLDRARRLLADPALRCSGGQDGVPGSRAHGRVLVGVLPEAPEGYLPFQTAPFPLTLVPRRDQDGTLRLEAHRRPDAVGEPAARRFAGQVARVHAWISRQQADTVPDDADLLDSAEREAVAELGRARTGLRWQPARIDSVFTRQAMLTPDAVAVTHGTSTLTYHQVHTRATQLAAGLRAHGVAPGDHVGVCLERSADFVVCLLAVLLADAVYVPMDPAYPAARLAQTIEDAGLATVITELTEIADVPSSLVRPDALHAAGAAAPDLPAARRGPESPAYIIYTSGSTGRPKGVVIPHRNVVALINATRPDFALTGDDVWTFFHSGAFDFSVWEIWGALLTGARVVVVPYWDSRSPEQFHRLLVREQVTVLSQTPSAFAQLAAADREQSAELPVRLVVLGGEPLDTGGLRGWLDRHPESQCRLVNMFGITETTVHVTAQTVRRDEVLGGTRSVGHPLPGWHVYVLDQRGRVLPPGVPGEIHVGGEGVAHMYWNRPELTGSRFVADPFTDGRMYRSGDRGRLLPDGRLEHLGRLDNQVKLRGFRIELDEIRNVLLEDPCVTSCAVVLGGDPGGSAARTRIDAYVVLAPEADSDTASVRQRAAGLLPAFMVPSTVTALGSLPLTINGKIDARRLPPPAIETRTVTDDGNASGLAARLADLWQDILGVPVGLDENFFALGGNSLSAVQLAAEARNRDMPVLPLRALYSNPTVRALATVLDQRGATG